MQTKLRTYELTPYENICFPIGTIVAIENLYERLNFPYIFGKHKTKGIDFNSLIKLYLAINLQRTLALTRLING